MVKCFVPFCNSGYKNCKEKKISMFKAPTNPVMLLKWRKAIPRYDRKLTVVDSVCEKHFEQCLVVKTWSAVHNDHVVMEGARRATLVKEAVPTIFPKNYSPVRKTGKHPNVKNESVKLNNEQVENGAIDYDDAECTNILVPKMLTFQMLRQAVTYNQIRLPNQSWAIHMFDQLKTKSIIISTVMATANGRFVTTKQICINDSMMIQIFCLDTSLDLDKFDIRFQLSSLEDVELLIQEVHMKQLCRGGPGKSTFLSLSPEVGSLDVTGVWRHKLCPILLENRKQCNWCQTLKETTQSIADSGHHQRVFVDKNLEKRYKVYF